MAEPRLTIRNVATGNLLYVERGWKATTSSDDKAGEKDAIFKVQWCERTSEGVATVVMIRTDTHPQSLLDARDLRYQGSGVDLKKCYDKNRWWKLTWLEVAKKDGKPTVLIRSYSKGTYLAEKKSCAGVELISLRDDADLKNVPNKAKWELSVGGRALSPGQVAMLASLPIRAALGGFGGMAGGIAVAVGSLAGPTSSVLSNVLKDVSGNLFVDW